VACVVHFDPPEDDKTYLHRSGRTARAGAQGVVVSFVRDNNRKDVKTLQRDLGLPQVVTVPDATLLGDGSRHAEATSRAKAQPPAKAAAAKPSGGGGGNGGRNRQRTRTRDGEDRAARRDTRRGPDGVVDVDPRPRKQREGGAPKVHRKGGGAKRRSVDANRSR
jgi:superfamily II DNA/RNA helicase